MARLISQTGQTASMTIGSPQQGMKWIVKWVYVQMNTGSTTGNRQAMIGVVRANNSINNGGVLAFTTSQSGTNTSYGGYGDVVNSTIYATPTALTQFYQFPEIYAVDVVKLIVNLQSGDTVDYYIMVEEAPS